MGPHSPLGGGFGEILSPVIYMGMGMGKLERSGDGDVVGIPIGDCPHCHSYTQPAFPLLKKGLGHLQQLFLLSFIYLYFIYLHYQIPLKTCLLVFTVKP
jgi:hypothetical protein